MKANLKTRINNLLSGSEKQDIIIIDTFDCEPGTYRYQDRIINEVEKEALKAKCKRLYIFALHGQKAAPGGSKDGSTVINITSRHGAQSLRDFLTK